MMRLLGLGAVVGLVALVGAHWLLAGVLYDDLPGPPLPPMDPPTGLASLSAAQCAACHAEIHAEWAVTRHGEAFTDPLYQADLAHQGEPYVCAYCHTPLVEQRPTVVSGIRLFWPSLVAAEAPNPRYVEGFEREGVTCATCHMRGGAMVASHEVDSPHATRADPGFASVEMCRPCHSLDITFGTKLVRPIQDTFEEWEAYRAAGGDQTCIDCHMPRVEPRSMALDRPARPGRSHALRGPRDVAFLRTGVVIEGSAIEASAGAVRARLTIFNGSGHRIPTAEPQRRVEVVLEALDEAGAALASSREVIQRAVQMPAMREEVGDDTTLKPRERRQLALEVQAPPGARRARLRVIYVVWDAGDALVAQAGLSSEDLVLEIHSEIIGLD